VTEAVADSSGWMRRRLAMLAALVWWGTGLAFIPHARVLIEALRSRSLLVLSVTLAAGLLFVGLVLAGILARRAGWLRPRQVAVATVLVGVALLVMQLLSRPEDRWHVIQYGVLAVMFWLAARGEGMRRSFVAMLATAACGWLDEAVQFLVPSRVYDLWDAGLNALAGVVGVGIVEMSRLSSRRKGA
jgi:VanZ family protein